MAKRNDVHRAELDFQMPRTLDGGVGDRIRQKRLERGLTLHDVASPGVSYAYVSRIERHERTPSVKALRLLARDLGVTVHWLETGRDDPGETLARLVLDHEGRRLPASAYRLARAVLTAAGAPGPAHGPET